MDRPIDQVAFIAAAFEQAKINIDRMAAAEAEREVFNRPPQEEKTNDTSRPQ